MWKIKTRQKMHTWFYPNNRSQRWWLEHLDNNFPRWNGTCLVQTYQRWWTWHPFVWTLPPGSPRSEQLPSPSFHAVSSAFCMGSQERERECVCVNYRHFRWTRGPMHGEEHTNKSDTTRVGSSLDHGRFATVIQPDEEDPSFFLLVPKNRL